MLFKLLFACIDLLRGTYTGHSAYVEVRGQLSGISSFHVGPRDETQDIYNAWQQVHLSAKLSHWPQIGYYLKP